MQKLILLAGLLAVSAHLVSGDAQKRLVCIYQETSDPFDIATDIDPDLCTHLIFSSVKPTPFTVSLAGLVQKVQAFNNLKTSNTDLKTFLEVDLTMANSQIFLHQNRPTLIDSIVDILNDANFDGVNVFWVYGESGDKETFTLLMQELKLKLPQGKLLTASVSGVPDDIENSYEISNLAGIVDFFNVMTFEVDLENPPQFPNADAAMQLFVTAEVPAGKLNMGIAIVWARYEVCQDNPNGVSIDGDATIIAKVAYIETECFGGAYVKSLDLDDFNGNCNQGEYPVIQLIKDSFTQ
ncbi:chitinase-3-like protein 2 [Syngnathus typhle]|uniref:chitinase-3-like protein 2 n=1 Tax=Syngnathus typhle TaxID=161592 RepID=UPI002A6B2144|nr:chitinase-3-like protein 2 [Syngnathus typhle]